MRHASCLRSCPAALRASLSSGVRSSKFTFRGGADPKNLGSWILFWYVYYTEMDFGFDPEKSSSNRDKHGIDFLDAQEVWNDLFAIEVQAKSQTEKRFALVGAINGKIWTVFFTERAEKIRIISVRRARTKEEELYNESR